MRVAGVHLLNGGLYPELHRPQPVQTALLDPEQGPQISALVNEELFVAGLRPTFAERYDAAADSAEIWQATSRDGGERIGHLLIRYIEDRAEHAARWTAALEATDVPLRFIWGMLDPVSGAHMAERIRERLPGGPVRGARGRRPLAAAGSAGTGRGGAARRLRRPAPGRSIVKRACRTGGDSLPPPDGERSGDPFPPRGALARGRAA